MDPVIVRLQGGIGNQMFQFAFGKALSLRLGRPLLLDIKEYDNYKKFYGFELKKVFGVEDDVASHRVLKNVLGFRRDSVVYRYVMSRRFGLYRVFPKIKVEKSPQYDPIYQISEKASYFSGYFQCGRYFSDYDQEIRNIFSFNVPFDSNELYSYGLSDGVVTCSLHIRRGDYLSDRNAASFIGFVGQEYFARAIEYCVNKLSVKRFLVFSDDIGWAKDHIRSAAEMRFIDSFVGQDSYRNMQLMSLCDHHIISNSSFSWWGAWLNSSIHKTVVAPANWFSSGAQTDIVDNDWIQL